MPRYHDQGDVEGLLSQIRCTFSETSTITLTKLATYIEDTERYADSRLAKVYAVPIEDTEAKAVLKPICTMLTAAKCWRILYAAQAGESDKAKEWQKEAEAALGMIVNEEMAFGDAAKARAAAGLASGMKDSSPIWKLGQDQW
ncbi:MAG: hypothetical protein ACYDDN_03785 [Candidatus Desulforudaceae bacterium]